MFKSCATRMFSVKDTCFRKTLVEALNQLESVTCNKAKGAMYIFPCLHLQQKSVKAAEAVNLLPDSFYAPRLLEATGVVVVPTSRFWI